jgi:hypothetical protein
MPFGAVKEQGAPKAPPVTLLLWRALARLKCRSFDFI